MIPLGMIQLCRDLLPAELDVWLWSGLIHDCKCPCCMWTVISILTDGSQAASIRMHDSVFAKICQLKIAVSIPGICLDIDKDGGNSPTRDFEQMM